MIKATVRYSSEHFIALNKQFGPSAVKRTVVLVICTIIATIYTVLAIFMLWHSEFNIYTVLYVVLAVLLLRSVIKGWYNVCAFRKKLRNQKPVPELRRFTFDDEKVCMLCEKIGSYEDRRIHYSELLRAVETSDFFFIEVTPNAYYIIGKNELTEGSPEELRTLLTSKLGSKFEVDY